MTKDISLAVTVDSPYKVIKLIQSAEEEAKDLKNSYRAKERSILIIKHTNQ